MEISAPKPKNPPLTLVCGKAQERPQEGAQERNTERAQEGAQERAIDRA